MFNATRLAVAVAILTLVGSLAYVTAPTVHQAITPAAPAAIDPTDFAGFSGTFRANRCSGGELTDFEWGHTLDGSLCSSMKLDVSDERLSGTARALHNAVRFKNGPTYGVRTLDTEIVNADGTWTGTGIAFHDADDDIMRYEFLLTGHGDYDGLSAMLSLTSDTSFLTHEAEGVIFPGELPSYPVLDDVETPPAWTGDIDGTDYGGFTGEVVIGGGQGTGQAQLGQFGPQVRDVAYWDMEVGSTDPRIAGVQESLVNYDHFGYESHGRVHTSADRIVNDSGSWVGTAYGYIHPDTGTVRYIDLLSGEGSYEGLSAISIASLEGLGGALDTVGVIFPGELPPYPELPPAE